MTSNGRRTQEQGDDAAADLAAIAARLVERSSVRHGGMPVTWLGDGVMFHFRDPGPGVRAALEIVDGLRATGLPPAHVGLHAGPVLLQAGDDAPAAGAPLMRRGPGSRCEANVQPREPRAESAGRETCAR
jgi:class 3 adenylate cyclase